MAEELQYDPYRNPDAVDPDNPALKIWHRDTGPDQYHTEMRIDLDSDMFVPDDMSHWAPSDDQWDSRYVADVAHEDVDSVEVLIDGAGTITRMTAHYTQGDGSAAITFDDRNVTIDEIEEHGSRAWFLSDDVVEGTGLNDVLAGGPGDDDLYGYEGWDTAVIDANFADAAIAREVRDIEKGHHYEDGFDVSGVVVASEDDNDFLRGIETIQFNDQTVSVADLLSDTAAFPVYDESVLEQISPNGRYDDYTE